MRLQDQSPSNFAELFRQATAPSREELNNSIEQTQRNIQMFETKYGFSSYELKERFRRGVASDTQGMELHTWLMELNTLELSIRYRERFFP